jgi:hypothetical protein
MHRIERSLGVAGFETFRQLFRAGKQSHAPPEIPHPADGRGVPTPFQNSMRSLRMHALHAQAVIFNRLRPDETENENFADMPRLGESPAHFVDVTAKAAANGALGDELMRHKGNAHPAVPGSSPDGSRRRLFLAAAPATAVRGVVLLKY